MQILVETPLGPERASTALARLLRPTVGFSHPIDVLKDPHLDIAQKREVLSSWASDASAVVDRPTLRRLPAAPEPVLLSDVLDALRRLDLMEAADGRARD
jgi:hypothetical protein